MKHRSHEVRLGGSQVRTELAHWSRGAALVLLSDDGAVRVSARFSGTARVATHPSSRPEGERYRSVFLAHMRRV